MEKQFKKLKVKATRIPAVDASKGLDSYNIKKSWKCLRTTDKEYACTLSHLLAITTAYQNGDKVCLIFEDDMHILRLPTSNLISVAPADWDIIQLCAISIYNLYENPKSYFVPWRQLYFSTGAYLINRRGMINLLAMLAPAALNKRDLSSLQEVSFQNTRVRWLPFKSCNADYILYALAKTYTCCDVCCYENQQHQSTVQSSKVNEIIQSRSANIIKSVYERRGFLMPW